MGKVGASSAGAAKVCDAANSGPRQGDSSGRTPCKHFSSRIVTAADIKTSRLPSHGKSKSVSVVAGARSEVPTWRQGRLEASSRHSSRRASEPRTATESQTHSSRLPLSPLMILRELNCELNCANFIMELSHKGGASGSFLPNMHFGLPMSTTSSRRSVGDMGSNRSLRGPYSWPLPYQLSSPLMFGPMTYDQSSVMLH